MLHRLIELGALFLKLGTIGFGGPAVHYATMEDEVVQRRRWVTREYFLDLIGATNLIPGPNSTEMAIHIGYVRAGLPGLVVAGCSFILPAVIITTALAWVYVQYGQTPQLEPVLHGVKPAVLAVILSAGWRLGRQAINSWSTAVMALTVCLCSLLGTREFLLIVVAGVAGMLWLAWRRRGASSGGPNQGKNVGAVLVGVVTGLAGKTAKAAPGAGLAALGVAAAASPATLWLLAIVFLKVGLVLYGTGYVLLAYLQDELVESYGWLSQERLVEAIAIGQVTPGPILSTATFIGYVVMSEPGHPGAGVMGAAVATACIFFPSFVLVALTNPMIPKLRRSRIASAFLDAVNAASMGLMAAVTLKLAQNVFLAGTRPLVVDWQSLLIAFVAAAVVLRWKVPAAWLVLGGGVLGSLFALVGTAAT